LIQEIGKRNTRLPWRF